MLALSGEQELILDCLCEREAETAAGIAKYARLRREVALGILDYLRDRGYVESERVNKTWVYRITPEGRRAAVEYNPAVWSA